MECVQPTLGEDSSVLLIVDDYPENLLSMRALLQRQDWKVMTASSGVEALNLLLEHDIDLVLRDLKLPDMDGFEVARRMRGRHSTRLDPIIFLSANSHSKGAGVKGNDRGAG